MVRKRKSLRSFGREINIFQILYHLQITYIREVNGSDEYQKATDLNELDTQTATIFPAYCLFIGKRSLPHSVTVMDSFKNKEIPSNSSFIIHDHSDLPVFVSRSDTWTTLGKVQEGQQGVGVETRVEMTEGHNLQFSGIAPCEK